MKFLNYKYPFFSEYSFFIHLNSIDEIDYLENIPSYLTKNFYSFNKPKVSFYQKNGWKIKRLLAEQTVDWVVYILRKAYFC